MRELRGVPASPGATVAPALVLRPLPLPPLSARVDDREGEAARLADALVAVAGELEARAASAGREAAEILAAQAAMAADPELLAASRRAVLEEGVPAARAVLESGEVYAGALEASGDAYLAARASDVRDVCGRVARRLLGVPEQTLGSLTGPVVVVAHDIAPADVADLDTGHVRALVTEAGSRTSHTAILARALGVAAVVAVPALLDDLRDGVPVAVDGDSGRVLIDPGDTDREGFEARDRASAERRVAAAGAPLADLRLADGTAVELAANVGSLADVEAAVALGARAVGLLRTELVYLGRAAPPGEDEQAALFSACADRLGGGRLVIRTFDFGADKPVPFLREAPGPNPALGVRGIRLARRHPGLLETQLRAVARAAAPGRRLAVMAPMVATVEEARWFLAAADAAGLRGMGVEIGVMVEVPAAVLVAAELAAELDFLSIGTNDLAQYLHAADRQEGALATLQDPWSPALLRATAAVGAAVEGSRAWLGVCGEAAADPRWAVVAVGLGVRELSMGAGAFAAVHAALVAQTSAGCREAARTALAESGATGGVWPSANRGQTERATTTDPTMGAT